MQYLHVAFLFSQRDREGTTGFQLSFLVEVLKDTSQTCLKRQTSTVICINKRQQMENISFTRSQRQNM